MKDFKDACSPALSESMPTVRCRRKKSAFKKVKGATLSSEQA